MSNTTKTGFIIAVGQECIEKQVTTRHSCLSNFPDHIRESILLLSSQFLSSGKRTYSFSPAKIINRIYGMIAILKQKQSNYLVMLIKQDLLLLDL